MSRLRVLLAAIVAACVAAAPAGAAEMLSPPTSAPVHDPFRPPDGPYGAGNRGIEYGTGVGDIVVAAADGTVAFAGPVAGSRFVSIDHAEGLRTTYGFVRTMLVRPGSAVGRGDPVATTDGPFHFTVRRDGRYLDPAGLLGASQTRVRLVPHGGPQARSPWRIPPWAAGV